VSAATATYQRERRRLADRLRTLRQEAGFSGNRLAKRLGWPQSKVSKIETAKQLPTDDDIRQWAAAVGSGDAAAGELLALLERARAEYATWKEHYRAAGGVAAKQADSLALEAQATRIAEFEPAFIPGFLQTAEYARELVRLPSGPAAFGASEAELEQTVAVRLQRQQALYDPRKTIRVIVLEAALRSRVCSPATLEGQLDRLLAVAGLPALELGIIPFEAEVPVYPLHGFAVFDHDLVLIETMTGEQQLNDPEEVALYDRFFQLLHDAAHRGRKAAAIIQRALAELRAVRAS
jgi:transcriptional regulator with XRE-family HTH domain